MTNILLEDGATVLWQDGGAFLTEASSGPPPTPPEGDDTNGVLGDTAGCMVATTVHTTLGGEVY